MVDWVKWTSLQKEVPHEMDIVWEQANKYFLLYCWTYSCSCQLFNSCCLRSNIKLSTVTTLTVTTFVCGLVRKDRLNFSKKADNNKAGSLNTINLHETTLCKSSSMHFLWLNCALLLQLTIIDGSSKCKCYQYIKNINCCLL